MGLEYDTAIIMEKGVALNITSSRHYGIPIDKTETSTDNFKFCLTAHQPLWVI